MEGERERDRQRQRHIERHRKTHTHKVSFWYPYLKFKNRFFFEQKNLSPWVIVGCCECLWDYFHYQQRRPSRKRKRKVEEEIEKGTRRSKRTGKRKDEEEEEEEQNGSVQNEAVFCLVRRCWQGHTRAAVYCPFQTLTRRRVYRTCEKRLRSQLTWRVCAWNTSSPGCPWSWLLCRRGLP